MTSTFGGLLLPSLPTRTQMMLALSGPCGQPYACAAPHQSTPLPPAPQRQALYTLTHTRTEIESTHTSARSSDSDSGGLPSIPATTLWRHTLRPKPFICLSTYSRRAHKVHRHTIGTRAVTNGAPHTGPNSHPEPHNHRQRHRSHSPTSQTPDPLPLRAISSLCPNPEGGSSAAPPRSRSYPASHRAGPGSPPPDKGPPRSPARMSGRRLSVGWVGHRPG